MIAEKRSFGNKLISDNLYVYVGIVYIKYLKMELPNSDTIIKPMTSSENIIKPVPRPFSIEALMSDSVPKRTVTNMWSPIQPYNHMNPQISTRDTDSDGSLDMELAQDLSRRSDKESEFEYLFSELIHCSPSGGDRCAYFPCSRKIVLDCCI